MSSRNQYKALLTSTKQELLKTKKALISLEQQFTKTNHRAVLLTAELERMRTRKWYQFWKFFKRNQLI